ncbi:RSF1: Remodeling and spacing factor 1 [Crotalus adamanteus]|uniref:RSF1: Remodeling and spacing factor 1 n=1 Tax=Crotalus adamanteus TaxID=8729 RepID=A0AAW1BMJ3_CROAD
MAAAAAAAAAAPPSPPFPAAPPSSEGSPCPGSWPNFAVVCSFLERYGALLDLPELPFPELERVLQPPQEPGEQGKPSPARPPPSAAGPSGSWEHERAFEASPGPLRFSPGRRRFSWPGRACLSRCRGEPPPFSRPRGASGPFVLLRQGLRLAALLGSGRSGRASRGRCIRTRRRPGSAPEGLPGSKEQPDRGGGPSCCPGRLQINRN